MSIGLSIQQVILLQMFRSATEVHRRGHVRARAEPTRPDHGEPGQGEPDAELSAAARYFRVLGDPTRLRLLVLLLDGPRSVSDLVAATGVGRSRVSNHLACLRWCRFVEATRRGRRVLYRVVDPRVGELLDLAATLAAPHRDHLATCRRIGPDWI
jgi:DNA-binding transcriptional ArsR family regulator